MISRKLIIAIKLANEPAYRIAQRAGLDPSTMSKLMCGIVQVRPNDHRVLAVGRILGLNPEECFEQGKPTDGKA